MMQTEQNIKPCPFCGKKPKLGICEGTYGYTPNQYYISCDKCGATMYLIDDYTKSKAECETELINRWNSRNRGTKHENRE